LKASFRGGVHPAHHSKRPTRYQPIQDFVSDTVRIIMSMHIGAPSVPVVKEGDHVNVGDLIAETPEGAMGALIHASISGRVESVGNRIVIVKD